MLETREISALFTLIDDPDEEIFSTVGNRIMDFGTGIIPHLENLWEHTINEEIQERIETLIHRLHFTELKTDFEQWRDGAYNDLLFGALMVAKFQYPDLESAPVLLEIEKMRRNIWLELNTFLTPLEKANVISSILYNFYKLKGQEVSYTNADDFFLHKVLQSKKGNAISNGILYLILCELLHISARAINIPRQFIIAFYQSDVDLAHSSEPAKDRISFFVDATTGQPFTHKDLHSYFKRISIPPVDYYFKPLSHKRIIQLLLEEVSKCFDTTSLCYKQSELRQLASLIDQ